MIFQFDGELTDIQSLQAELESLDILSIKTSRWISVDPTTGARIDEGGRIDIEIQDEADNITKPKAQAIQLAMENSNLVSPKQPRR